MVIKERNTYWLCLVLILSTCKDVICQTSANLHYKRYLDDTCYFNILLHKIDSTVRVNYKDKTVTPDLNLAYKLAISAKNTDMLARVYIQQAKISDVLDNFHDANILYNKALKITNKDKTRGDCYLALAINNIQLYRDREAATCSKKAFTYYQKIGSEKGLSDAYLILGVLQGRVGNTKRQLFYFNKAETYFLKNDLLDSYSTVLLNRALCYTMSKISDSGKVILKRVISLNSNPANIRQKKLLVNAYLSLAYRCYTLGENDSCYHFCERVKRVSDSLDIFYSVRSKYYSGLGAYYDGINKPKKAIAKYKEALSLNRNNNSKRILYDNISELYYNMKLYEDAFYYKDSAWFMSNEISKEEQEYSYNEILMMEKERVQDYKRQKLFYAAEAEKQKLNRINIVLIFSLLMFSLIIVILIILNKNGTLKLKKENLNSQLSFLKAQINPHFLFNSINNVYVLVKEGDRKTASDSLMKFSNLLRYQLYECDINFISIAKEIDYIENYISFEKLRYGEKINVTFSKPDNTHLLESVLIAPLLLQPFIENAFKHSGKNKNEKNYITIFINYSESVLTLIVENNFFKNESSGLPGGIGLINVRKRLEILYSKRYTININRMEGREPFIYRVELTMQLTKTEKVNLQQTFIG